MWGDRTGPGLAPLGREVHRSERVVRPDRLVRRERLLGVLDLGALGGCVVSRHRLAVVHAQFARSR